MLSLEEINLKLDRIEQAQSVLLAAQNELSARLTSLETEMAGDFAKLFTGHGAVLAKMTEWVDVWNKLLAPPAKQGKAGHKARRKQKKDTRSF